MSVLLVNGNSLSVPLADESVHCVVTSPPYWSLRDYGVNGQLGLERTPEEYVANMVAVFREVWRVMRDDGTLWLNLGDSYAGGIKGSGDRADHDEAFRLSKSYTNKGGLGYKAKVDYQNLKPKDLCGIPWRVAFALQADGWFLRSDIIWSKPNPMPESVTDRPTKAHEYLFLLAKAQKYYYDADAVREKADYDGRKDTVMKGSAKYENGFVPNQSAQTVHVRGHECWPYEVDGTPGRNRRTVWEIATQPYSGAHFATFPEKLVEPCIKAGTSERGVCPVCGAGWKRISEKGEIIDSGGAGKHDIAINRHEIRKYIYTREISTTGWQPACSHDADPIPATVFDPFAGSGTTLVVARKLGRHGIGLDLSRKYLAENARARLELDKWDAWVKP